MASISFSNPGYLFFLLVIPLLIFIHFATLKATRTSALKFANFPAIARIRGVEFFSKNILTLFLTIAVVFLLVMSLSGATLNVVIDASSYSFVVALDTSQSMEANDISPNRMEGAKESALDFVESAPLTTRIGVISFSGNVLIEQDLTNDKSLIKTAIRNIDISEIAGTDLYEAVITGTNLLKAEETKAIVLLSDGQVNVGGIEDAIEYANDNKVVLHTIAIGSEEGGLTSYGFSKLDEDSLKALAYNTDGVFSRALNKEELSNSLDEIIKKTRRKVGIELDAYLLIASIILFTIEYFLINSRYRRLV